MRIIYTEKMDYKKTNEVIFSQFLFIFITGIVAATFIIVYRNSRGKTNYYTAINILLSTISSICGTIMYLMIGRCIIKDSICNMLLNLSWSFCGDCVIKSYIGIIVIIITIISSIIFTVITILSHKKENNNDHSRIDDESDINNENVIENN